MSIKLYKGEIVFPAGNAIPSKFKEGESVINVRVRMDDPAAPKTDGQGEVPVYKNLSDPDSAYMQNLRRGDRVTLAWNEAGSKSNYSFVYDSTGDNAPPPYSKPQDASLGSSYINKRPDPSAPVVNSYVPTVDVQPQGNMDAWRYAVTYELDMYKEVLGLVIMDYPDFDPQAQHALAQRIHGWAHGWWRPGAVFAGHDKLGQSDEDEREAFLQLVKDNGDDARAWLTSASVILEAEDKDVLDVITKLGIQSGEWLKSEDGKWDLVLVVREYWRLAQQGMDHGDIGASLNKRFGVKLPAKQDDMPF